MPLDAFLERLRKAPDLGPHVARWHREPAREAIPADFPEWTPPAVLDAFRAAGIERLWSHQREAADLAHATRRGRLIPGEGAFDWSGFLRTLAAIGSPAPLTVEVLNDELAAALPPRELARRLGDAVRALRERARPA